MEDRLTREAREIKRKIAVEPDRDFGICVFAVAISKDSFQNDILKIPTRSGEPICNEVHDIVRDCYYCHGVDYHEIGDVPVGFRLTMGDGLGWVVDVPLPFSVVKRYLTQRQKTAFEQWKQPYPPELYDVKFLQVKCVF